MTSNTTASDLDVPIALRKPKRRSEAISPVKTRVTSDSIIHSKTPSTRRSKRVRFSDPGLFSPSSNLTSTSLTPALRRSSLGTPRQRRPATPGRPAIEGPIQFTPFTQILDERCRRRIRRNGLSDEMNQYEAFKKNKASLLQEIDEKDAELQRLRAELDAARAQPPPTEQDMVVDLPESSQQRVDEVEAELDALRRSFAMDDEDDRIVFNAEPEQPEQISSWSHVPHAPGPSSDGGDTILIHEDDETEIDASRFPSRQITNSDAFKMGLELEAARAAKSTLLDSFRNNNNTNTSFDFHFADSPAQHQGRARAEVNADIDAVSTTSTFQIPDTPPQLYHDIAKQLKTTTNRAEEAELALTALDIEITNLGFGNPDADDTLAMVSQIATHFRSARLELEHLVPGENTSGFNNPAILPQILGKLKSLAEKLKTKEKEVKSVSDQHRNLKGNFEKAIIAAEKANDEVKRLESALDSAVEESLHVRIRSQELEKDIQEKERDITALSGALDKYRADILRLEGLINELQAEYAGKEEKMEELEARVASETTGRRAAEGSAVERLARINELEITLEVSRCHAAELEEKLRSVADVGTGDATLSTTPDSSPLIAPHQRQLVATVTTAATGTTTTDCDSELASLQTRVSSLSTALTHATSEVTRLKLQKARLEDRVRTEVAKGAAAVEALQEQLIRGVLKGNEAKKRYVNGAKVRIANWELQSEIEEESVGSDGPDCAESSTGTRTPSNESGSSRGRRGSSSGSSVRFAEWAEVETVERHDHHGRDETDVVIADQQHSEYDTAVETEAEAEVSGSESCPGSVEIYRGRSRYRKKPRLVSFDQARRGSSIIGAGLGISQGQQNDGVSSSSGPDFVRTKGRGRRYDSAIGMSSDDGIFEDEDCREQSIEGQGEVEVIGGKGGVRRRSGMMTPELSSDGDVERERAGGRERPTATGSIDIDIDVDVF